LGVEELNMNDLLLWFDEIRDKSSEIIHIFIDNKDSHEITPGIRRLLENLAKINNASVVCKSILQYQFVQNKGLIE
jgi:hypothetical protein